jgi:hypothetical protein
MSRALVVFESMFGNTEAVARAVASGLGEHLPVDVVEVGSAPVRPDGDVTLLVVGAPTHAFGLSRTDTRHEAADRRGWTLPVSSGIGVREWLELVHLRPGQLAATFATRTAMRWVPGSAAGAIHRRLRRAGLDLVVPARSFHVVGIEGPLVPGELDRARAWGDQLGASLTVRAEGAPS